MNARTIKLIKRAAGLDEHVRGNPGLVAQFVRNFRARWNATPWRQRAMIRKRMELVVEQAKRQTRQPTHLP